MKILVADDDSVVRAIIKRVVSQTSHEFLQAEDGLEALRLIERDDPDVLVTDLHMPVLDGFELIAAVRNSPLHKGMPIVCLSAVNDRDALARVAMLGVTDSLLKPIRPRDLEERLLAATSKNAKWKFDRGHRAAWEILPTVLVVDPDVRFRSFVASALAPAFTIAEATTGANALNSFRSQTADIAAVLVSEGLELLDEERIAELLRRFATERGCVAPPVILVSATGEVSPEKAARFDGIVLRSAETEVLLAAVAASLPRRHHA